MNQEEHRIFSMWRKKIINKKDILPIQFGMTQEDVISKFGKPDDVSSILENGKPLIFKYQDIEFHFDERFGHTLFLVYSDYKIDISIMAESTK